MSMDRLRLGARGEEEAARVLEENGYTIVERNFRSRYGEIDLVAMHNNTVVFVEVKTRSSNAFGAPTEAVDSRKRRHIVRASLDYLATRVDGEGRCDVRYDVVSIVIKDDAFDTELIKNAFDAE